MCSTFFPFKWWTLTPGNTGHAWIRLTVTTRKHVPHTSYAVNIMEYPPSFLNFLSIVNTDASIYLCINQRKYKWLVVVMVHQDKAYFILYTMSNKLHKCDINPVQEAKARRNKNECSEAFLCHAHIPCISCSLKSRIHKLSNRNAFTCINCWRELSSLRKSSLFTLMFL